MTSSVDRPVGGRHRRAAEPQRRTKREQAALILAVLCIPVAAAAIVFLAATPSSSSSASLLSGGSESGLAAARSAVPTILSYDYRSIGADIAKAKANETGEFAKQYAKVAQPLLGQARQLKAIVQATVGSAGVVSTGPHTVVVLLFVDQATVRQVQGQNTPQTRIDQDRVLATMTNVNGKWLVSALAAL